MLVSPTPPSSQALRPLLVELNAGGGDAGASNAAAAALLDDVPGLTANLLSEVMKVLLLSRIRTKNAQYSPCFV